MAEQVDALSDKRPIGEDDLAKALEQAKADQAADKEARKAAETQAAAERTRREAAERNNTELATKLTGETDARFTAQESAVENAIAAAKSDADRLERDAARLMAEGKFEEAAKASRELGTAAAKLTNLEGQKAWLAGQKEIIKRQPPQQVKQPDPLDGYPPAAQAWIRANPQFLDEKSPFHKKAMKGHYDALDQGVDEGSPDYWRIVEEHTGQRKQVTEEVEDLTQPETTKVTRKAQVDVAPVTRRAGPGKQPAQQTVKLFDLTPAEIEMAEATIEPGNSKITNAERYQRYNAGKTAAKERGLMN